MSLAHFAPLAFDDARWTRLHGGYRVPYDPRPSLNALRRGADIEASWENLWTGLYHQGDIGDVAFVAVPHLVRIHEARGVADWNTYALAATIELARDDPRNPELPTDFRASYDAAWARLVDLGLREFESDKGEPLAGSILGVLAIARGQRTLGRLAIEYTDDERRDVLRKLEEG